MKTFLFSLIASILAILFFETWKYIIKSIRNIKLRKVLDLRSKICYILSPIYPTNDNRQMLKHRDAYAFVHLFELCNRVGVEVQLIPSNKIPEFSDAMDIFSVGGEISNIYTKKIIDRYLNTIRLVKGEEASDFTKTRYSNKNITGFQIGSKKFLANDISEPAILVKLTENELNQDRSIHLIMGYSDQGTAGGAYYIWKYYRKICKRFKSRKYCIVVNVSRTESYKTVNKSFIDVTEETFNNKRK